MQSSAILPNQTQPRWRYRLWKLREESDNRLRIAAALHHKTEWGRIALDPLGRKTRLLPSGIRFAKEDPYVPEAGNPRSPLDALGESQSLAIHDAQFPQFHPDTAPSDRLGGGHGLIADAQGGKRLNGLLGAPEIQSARRIQSRGPGASPSQNGDRQDPGGDPRCLWRYLRHPAGQETGQ
jgi:hypothetical protein